MQIGNRKLFDEVQGMLKGGFIFPGESPDYIRPDGDSGNAPDQAAHQVRKKVRRIIPVHLLQNPVIPILHGNVEVPADHG